MTRPLPSLPSLPFLRHVQGSEDEEAMADEEEEALRLQREAAAALRPEDFGQSEEDEEGESSEEESGGWGQDWEPLDGPGGRFLGRPGLACYGCSLLQAFRQSSSRRHAEPPTAWQPRRSLLLPPRSP